MEKIKEKIKILFFTVILLAMTISDGSFVNIRKAEAAENQTYKYSVVINKPHVLRGELKEVIDSMVSGNNGIKKIENSYYMQIDISGTTDLASQYKSIVSYISSSTLYRNGYHMKLRVSCGSDTTSETKEVTLDTAKSMIFADSSSHRALFINWECDHTTDSSKWILTSAATCQHGNEYICSVCGETRAENDKLEHDYSVRCNDATCTELFVYKCTMCGSTIITEKYGEHSWVQKNAATCTNRRILYCETCGNTKEEGEMLEHEYTFDEVIEPTEVSNGCIRHSCVCGAYYDDKFTYKIEYDANGGIGNIESQIVNYDSDEVLKQNTFAKEGCYFTGWNTKEDGTGTSYEDGQVVKDISTSTVKLYAQWKKCKYIVACVDCYEDGSIIDSINNNKTMEVEGGDMVSGENFGKDNALGAYYPGLRYLYSDDAVIVLGNVNVKRYFRDFKKYGLTDAVVSEDMLEKVPGKSEDIIIPDEIKAIGDEAFAGNTDVKRVEIKNGTLTKIGDKAFENCTGLKEIILPYSVKSIGKDAFKGCTSLEKIEIKNPDCKIDGSYDTIPEKTEIRGFSKSSAQTYAKKNHRNFKNITVIYDGFFCDEIYLNKFSIPDDVEVVGDNAFKDCGNLQKINLGKVTSIGKSAFENCVSLEYDRDFSKKQEEALLIPASVTKIGERAFFNDKKIAQIKFEGKNTNIEDKTAIDENTFIGCYVGSQAYDFAKENKYKTVLLIGFGDETQSELTEDYKNNTEIKAVIIGDKINEIDEFTFAGCTGLEYVGIISENSMIKEIKIGNSAFLNCSLLEKFECDENVEISALEDNSFSGCDNLKELVISNPNCVISDKEKTISDNTEIKGWGNSSVRAYCEKHNKKFSQIGISHIIGFNKQGGNGGEELIYVYPGMNMPSVTLPEKAGYVFKGYYDGDRQYYNAVGEFVLGEELKIEEDMIGDKALEAVWSVEKYNVLFDANGAKGNMDMLKDVEYDSEFLAPDSEFVMEGYHFVGWSISEQGNTDIYKAGDKIKNLTVNGGQTVKLYAQWEANFYSIEYNLNGGVGKMPENVSVLYNDNYIIPENEGTKEYYIFTGWNTRYDGRGESFSAGQQVKQLSETQGEKIILYAQWKPVIYNIYLNPDGGVLSYNKNSLQYNCETIDFEIKEPKKHGYEFIGWSDGNSDKLNKKVIIKKGSHGDIKLNANYKPAEYNVKFETNEGAFKDNSKVVKTYKFGDDINLPTDVEKQNYIFKGWSIYQNSNNADVTRIISSDTGDKIFYAVWMPASYNITYVTDGGSIEDTQKATAFLYGTGTRLPENVTRQGYSFAGWYLNEKCTGQMVTTITASDTGDKTFYAKWLPDEKNDLNTSAPDESSKPEQSMTPLESNKPQESMTPNSDTESGGTISPSPTGNNETAVSKKAEQSTSEPSDITISRPHKLQGTGRGDNKNNSTNKSKSIFKYGNYNKKRKTVTLKSICNREIKKAVVPATVKYKGTKYKVTDISSGAFKNCKKLKTVVIGKNVKTLGKNCFKNCRKLKKITVKSMILRKVCKNSLEKTNRKLKIVCNKKKIKKYRKIFENKGNKIYRVIKK